MFTKSSPTGRQCGLRPEMQWLKPEGTSPRNPQSARPRTLSPIDLSPLEGRVMMEATPRRLYGER